MNNMNDFWETLPYVWPLYVIVVMQLIALAGLMAGKELALFREGEHHGV